MDRRSAITERLYDLLAGLDVTLSDGAIAAGNIVRNRNELPAGKVPGIIVLDADEVKDPRSPDISGRNMPVGPSLVRMTPEVYIVLNVRKPNNANVGQDLNVARAEILRLVLHDPQLSALVGANGAITYDGCVTDLARNRTMQGQMGLSITFTYPLLPGELVAA
jgi:hypothetical protein